MTKEQFINKWPYLNDTRDTINPYFISDLDAVIAHEVAKVQEAQPQPIELKGNCSTFDGSRLVDQVQPALNPIELAYEMGEKIRSKNWKQGWWIQKHSHDTSINKDGVIEKNDWLFNIIPNSWELYTEPAEQPEIPSSQVKLDNSFDKDRFEAMFRAVVANGGHELDHKQAIELTEEALKQLDVYYATKEGGANE